MGFGFVAGLLELGSFLVVASCLVVVAWPGVAFLVVVVASYLGSGSWLMACLGFHLGIMASGSFLFFGLLGFLLVTCFVFYHHIVAFSCLLVVVVG